MHLFPLTGIPWVLSASFNPLGISDKNVPPAFSGLSVHGNRDQWRKFQDTVEDTVRNHCNDLDTWLIKNGGQPLNHKRLPLCLNYSPYANIYMCPKELDYTAFRPNPPNWHHFETFIRSSNESSKVPAILTKLPGRLIYFSMGSLGSTDVKLMKRLVDILGKSSHRFIVSKGMQFSTLVSDSA